MKRACAAVVLAGLLILASGSELRAEGWSLPNLNPFKSRATADEPVEEPLNESDDEPIDDVVSEADDEPFDDEPFDPDPFAPESDAPAKKSSAKKSSAKSPSAKPSAWKRFSTGSKKFLTHTGEVLNPFDGKPVKKAPTKSLTGGASYSGVRKPPAAEKPSLFSSMTGWMKPKEEPKQTRTVTDFIDMPRPY